LPVEREAREQPALRHIKGSSGDVRILTVDCTGASVMYQRILVPVDGSSTSQRGLDEAIRLALLTRGRLRLLHVIDELSFALAMDAHAGYAGDWLSVLRESGERLLEDAKAAAKAAGVEADVVLCDRLSGKVHELVASEAARWPADLIVLGTHGRRGVGRSVMGNSAEHILRHATVPILLVRAPENEPGPGRKETAQAGLPTEDLAFE
jgi:nucleotide-binding universal stress UspA family protein